MAKIKSVTLKDGTTRYRFVVDVGEDPVTGKRLQKTHTFDTESEAVAELARMKQVRDQLAVFPGFTVDGALDVLLPVLAADVKPATARNYADAMRPVRTRLGYRQLQSLDEQDIDDLVSWMLTEGRTRGGKPGTGLGEPSAKLTLGRLRAALNEAVRRGMVIRNVAAFTKIPSAARSETKAMQRPTWPSRVLDRHQ